MSPKFIFPWLLLECTVWRLLLLLRVTVTTWVSVSLLLDRIPWVSLLRVTLLWVRVVTL